MSDAAVWGSAQGGASGWFKWSFRCGRCGRTWRERLPVIDYPTMECPSCGTLNKINVVTT